MPRKAIHIITPHFAPEITAAAHRMESAAGILSASFCVNVFTLSERGSNVREHSIKFSDNLTVHYLPVKNYDKSFFIVRAFYEWLYACKLLRKANSMKADLAIVTIPFMFLLPVAAMLCKTKMKILDIRDIVWNYLPEDSFFRRLIKKNMMKWMHHSMRKFDAITVTNEAEKKWLMHRAGISENTLRVIPNGVSKEKFNRLAELVFNPHPQKFTITYVGNIGSSQHFYALIDAIRNMKDVRLNLVGNGNEWKNIKKYLLKNNIQNVFLHEKKKWTQTLPYYQSSNLLFASLKEDFDTAIPSKLYEYLASGLPVLYLGKGAAADFLSTFNNCFLVGIYEAKYLERVIWNVKRLSPARSEKNIQAIKRNFIREKVSNRFTEVAAKLINEPELSNVYIEDILMGMEM